MRPKILFLVPPCFASRALDFEIAFPVHLGFLGRVAIDCEWSVQYLDMTLEEKEGNNSFDILDEILSDSSIRFVGISNHTIRTSITTRLVADRVKKLRPDLFIVVGGVNATFMWRELLESCESIDFIIRGYGQPGLRILLKSVESDAINSEVPGLVYRDLDGYRIAPLKAIEASDFLLPSTEGIDVDRYLDWTRVYPLLTHTGCGFSCNFCTSVMPGPYQNKETYRPIEAVIREMSWATSAGFNQFFMTANIFTSSREYCLDFVGAICAAGLSRRITWSCMTRVEFVDEVVLAAMSAAGCTNVAFGIEVAGEQQWRSLNKGRFSNRRIFQAFSAARSAGVSTTAYLMLGSPTQTMDDIESTISLLGELDPDYRVVSFFQPFPGTPYWNNLASFGLSEVASLEEWNFHEAPICRTTWLDKDALMAAAARLHLTRRANMINELSRCALSWEKPFSDLEGIPEPVLVAFRLVAAGLSIGEILETITLEHGNRGRLIALYALSAALRQNIMRVVDIRST